MFTSLLSKLLGMYLEVELLDPTLILCLRFWRSAIPFSTAAVENNFIFISLYGRIVSLFMNSPCSVYSFNSLVDGRFGDIRQDGKFACRSVLTPTPGALVPLTCQMTHMWTEKEIPTRKGFWWPAELEFQKTEPSTHFYTWVSHANHTTEWSFHRPPCLQHWTTCWRRLAREDWSL